MYRFCKMEQRMKILLMFLLLINSVLADGKLLGIEKISKHKADINEVKYYCVNNHVIADYINIKNNKHIRLPIVWTDVKKDKNVQLECKDFKKYINK